MIQPVMRFKHSREPVLGISARLANPLLTLRNLCISISLYNEGTCCQWWILGKANEADLCSECKKRFRVKTFFFREHPNFERKIEKLVMKSKQRPFFFRRRHELRRKICKPRPKLFFLRQHQFLKILASGS